MFYIAYIALAAIQKKQKMDAMPRPGSDADSDGFVASVASEFSERTKTAGL